MKKSMIFSLIICLISLLIGNMIYATTLSNNKIETNSYIAIVDYISFTESATKVRITIVNRTNTSLYVSWSGENSYIETGSGIKENFISAEGIQVGINPSTELKKNSSITFALIFGALKEIPKTLSVYEGNVLAFAKRWEFKNISVN